MSSVWFEFKQKCGSFTLREGKLEGTSAIYTLVKLRSVELPPSLQDMAVISWTRSCWSLCFTKAQGSTVEVVSVKLPRNGSMEVSYIQCYSATVYIYNTWIAVVRKIFVFAKRKIKTIRTTLSWQNLLHFVTKLVTLLVKTCAVSHAKTNWKRLAVNKQVGTFLDSGGESHEWVASYALELTPLESAFNEAYGSRCIRRMASTSRLGTRNTPSSEVLRSLAASGTCFREGMSLRLPYEVKPHRGRHLKLKLLESSVHC